MSTWTVERARLASLTRSRTADDPDLVAARRDLRAARLEDHIARVVAEAPPLTNEQRERLALLLTQGGGLMSPPGLMAPPVSGRTTQAATRCTTTTVTPDAGAGAE